MRKYFTGFVVWLMVLGAHAQNAFWSNNGLVSVKDGAYISIIGDAYNQNDGIYDNSDSIFVTGDWSHTAQNRCFDSIGTGWVYLYADTQRIKGTSITHFYNLILKGTGVKYGDIDVYVDGNLHLTDREFNLDTNTVWVLNPDTGSVHRTSGYVSSLQDGGLLRRTNSTLPYLFAVGSNINTLRYRPVEFVPQAVNENHFKVRFANADPTDEGFDRNIKFHLVCKINPNWYHRFFHISGTDSANITIMYDTTADGNWNDIAHWQNVPEWETIHRDTMLAAQPLFRMSKFMWKNYVFQPFALAITSDSFAFASNTGPYCSYDSIHLLSGPDSLPGYNWTGPNQYTSNQQNPIFLADGNGGLYTVAITNNLGCVENAATNVVVYVAPKPAVANTGPYCSYDTIKLTAVPDSLISYVWSGPNNFSSNLQNPTLPAKGNGGIYVITVTDNNACTGTAQTDVTVYVAPNAVAGVDTIMWRYDTIQLRGFGGDYYQWTPDFHLSCVDCNTPLAWPDSDVTYYLTVSGLEGCHTSDSVRVMVRDKPFSYLFIPNAITPNGDGYNDVWNIRDLERYPNNEVRILNRWGNEVFSQKPYQNQWGGTWNGQELPGGTYYYVLKIFYNGEDVKFDGPLTIIR